MLSFIRFCQFLGKHILSFFLSFFPAMQIFEGSRAIQCLYNKKKEIFPGESKVSSFSQGFDI